MPHPPRKTIFRGRLAENPARGPTSVKSVCTPAVLLTPFLPATSRVLVAGSQFDNRFSASLRGPKTSYRRSTLSVSYEVVCQSFCKYTLVSFEWYMGEN